MGIPSQTPSDFVRLFFARGSIRQYILPLLRAHWYLRGATSLGKRVRVWGNPWVENHGNLKIGNRVRIRSTVARIELYVDNLGSLEIGNGVFINYGTSIAASKSIQIGENCSLGTYVMIIDNHYHRLEPDRRYERPESLPVILECNVWLGGHVIVLPGVRIGEGSVVGAGSVVTRDIPPRSVAVGQPAKVIRTL